MTNALWSLSCERGACICDQKFRAAWDELGISHDVHVANSGREGIDLVRAIEPDLVLLDIGLPDLDGYQVATEIREDGPRKQPYLVAVTGYGLPRDKERAAAQPPTVEHQIELGECPRVKPRAEPTRRIRSSAVAPPSTTPACRLSIRWRVSSRCFR